MNAIARPALARHFHRIAWLAVALTACVVVFGAFVRLSDAGLSCPDWPTCYGRATWPSAPQDAATHAASEIRPFETHKAWREQVHRHLAASLGVLVLLLALLAARRRRFGVAIILSASALVAFSASRARANSARASCRRPASMWAHSAATSAGRMLATTEITPCPPSAR